MPVSGLICQNRAMIRHLFVIGVDSRRPATIAALFAIVRSALKYFCEGDKTGMLSFRTIDGSGNNLDDPTFNRYG